VLAVGDRVIRPQGIATGGGAHGSQRTDGLIVIKKVTAFCDGGGVRIIVCATTPAGAVDASGYITADQPSTLDNQVEAISQEAVNGELHRFDARLTQPTPRAQSVAPTGR
jgi:hypothetical protein